MAITTSLTDTPKAFFTALTVSRSTLRSASRRCGVIGRLNGVAGARPGVVAMTSPSPRFRPSMPPTRLPSAGRQRGQHPHQLVGEADGLHRPPGEPCSGERGQRGRAGRPDRRERLRCGDLAPVRGQVEQDRQQFGAGCAVDRRVMDLGVDRGPAPGEAGDQVDLPQRPAAVQRAGVQPGHLLGELGVGPWPRQRDLPDVVLDVEVRIIDPVRLIQAERER